MKTYRGIKTFNGVHLSEIISKRLKEIEIGDQIVYNQLPDWENGYFKSLAEFESFLIKNFDYEYLFGKEYNSWLFFEITEMKFGEA